MADLLVTGRIFTADDHQPWAQAVASRDGVIVHVGDLDQARAAVGDDAEHLDAGAGVVVPGFVDGHAHVVSAGSALSRAALRPCTTLEQIQSELLAWAEANPDAPRVLGVGWVFSAVPGGKPTRHMLDTIIPDRPVYLDASDLHSVWCNSAALAELGIDDDTPDPIGGQIVRDAHGVATGHLLENAG